MCCGERVGFACCELCNMYRDTCVCCAAYVALCALCVSLYDVLCMLRDLSVGMYVLRWVCCVMCMTHIVLRVL